MIAAGRRVVLTTDAWFYAPDGRTYRGVYGTIKAIHDDKETLGIRSNSRSANWYLEIGDMMVAGCQVHYAVECETPPPPLVADWREADGKVTHFERPSIIYNADGAAR